jgi:hypothetical protein
MGYGEAGKCRSDYRVMTVRTGRAGGLKHEEFRRHARGHVEACPYRVGHSRGRQTSNGGVGPGGRGPGGSACGGFALPAVGFGVVLGGFGGVMRGVMEMAVSRVGVMGGNVMIAGLIVLGGLTVMSRGVFMMLSGLAMMLDRMSGHGSSFENGAYGKMDRTPAIMNRK